MSIDVANFQCPDIYHSVINLMSDTLSAKGTVMSNIKVGSILLISVTPLILKIGNHKSRCDKYFNDFGSTALCSMHIFTKP